MNFIIRPPYYQTAWFYIAIGLLILAVFYGIYKNRINQIRSIHNVREKIASDLHDDIGSRLTNISMLSVMGENEGVAIDERNNYLKKISEEAMASGEALDEIVQNMHMHDDELDDITSKLRRYALKLFDNGSPKLIMNIDEKINTRTLALEKKRDLFLIFKEILNNINKHASAKIVGIEMKSAGKMLFLKIYDDGIGFETEVFTNRNGIRNIKARVKKWKGRIEILTAKNKGCRIIIHLPFEKKSYIKMIFGKK